MSATHEPLEPVSSRAGWRARLGRRWTGPALVLAAALVVGPLAGGLPSERVVVLDLADRTGIERLELSWLEGDELLQTAALSPHAVDREGRIRTRLRVPDGSYRLEVRLFRDGKVATSTRWIDFGDGVDSITVPVD